MKNKRTPITANMLPYKVMRPALTTLRGLGVIGVAATDLHKTDHRPLAARIMAMAQKTDDLKNPPRKQMIVHMVAWYMVNQELAEAVKDSHPELARSIHQGLMGFPWLGKIVDAAKEVNA